MSNTEWIVMHYYNMHLHNNSRYHTYIYANIIIKKEIMVLRGRERPQEKLEEKGWYGNDVNNYV